MAIIAVAGGTGNVGRAIVEAILATGGHEVKILSRKVLCYGVIHKHPTLI
jgi:nucleoside-diphosphate-sugar epimerase